ncbi:2-hydroxy-6-oxo-6-phenylhexa-2,4-dienoate hydrolase [Actinomycetales bacterium JB111]|nr:2-hydroxy-6-oxo-6-phenylhexa-2,4-dienoate hydrolase [Actinomycetales bacterium JB111]
MALTPHDVELGGLVTRYYEGGDPTAPSVLLVHDGSYGSDALLSFGAVAELLADEFHVVLPDLLGWGGSAKSHRFDESLYAPRIRQLAQLASHLGITEVHAVGNSFGGSLLLHAAIEKALPLASVTSIAGTGGPWRSETGLTAMADYRTTEADARRISNLVVTDDVASAEHVEHRYRNSTIPGHWESIRAWGLKNPDAPAAAPGGSYPESLGTVSVPVLLVEGDSDVMVDAGWTGKAAEAAPSVRTRGIDTGHSPNIDRPDVVADLVREVVHQTRP